MLRCPDDNTVQTGQGNLSYAVNGGFNLWHAIPYGWDGSLIDGGGVALGSTKSPGLIWDPTGSSLLVTIGITQKLGVMFLETGFPQGVTQLARAGRRRSASTHGPR